MICLQWSVLMQVVFAVTDFVRENIGQSFIEPPRNDLPMQQRCGHFTTVTVATDVSACRWCLR